MPEIHVAATPNPDSLKFTSDAGPFVEQGLYSFASAAQAEAHPLGQALFGLDGVANVLLLPAFVTVTKAASADWNGLLPRIQVVLADHLERSRAA
jgi:hypothetical protein